MLAGSAGPSVRIGVGMAVDRRTSGMAARSAMGGVTVAVAGVLGACGFVHAIDRVLSTPTTYGANYDALIAGVPGEEFLPDADIEDSLARLIANPSVESAALVKFPATGDNMIKGPSAASQLLDPTAYENRKGSIPLTVLDGRAPTSADEAAIGKGALAALDADIGDYVDVSAGEQTLRFRVVGTVLYPSVDELDDSVVLTSDGLALIDAAIGVPADTQGIVVRFERGTDTRAAFAELRRDFPTIERPPVPSAVLNLDEIGPLPYYLAAFLGFLGAAAMAHALVMTARRRRRDLAVCRAIGMLPRQVVGALGAHALINTLVGLVLGIPFGYALGRQLFALVARRTHVIADFPVPFGLTLLVVPAAIVIALVLAVAPAAVAARVSPADILRAE
jgi:putative ABC transport system permease protein